MSQSMNDYYTDFEELRPIGEASHIPMMKLSECGDSAAHRQRVATTEKGYPNDATESNTGVGPVGRQSQTGRRNAGSVSLTISSDAASTNESASTTFLGIIHLIVESTTFYGAVAKGGAAANLLSANQAEPAVDDYTLIYDLDEAPARQLAEQWPSLPDAVQVSSAEGEGLLSAARDRTGWHGQEASGVRSRPQRGSTTNVGTASATRRVLTRSSTTPTTRCGWFQRWR